MNNKERSEVHAALKNWRDLNDALLGLTEEQVRFALKTEQKSKTRRSTVVKRLTQRLVAMETLKAREKFAEE